MENNPLLMIGLMVVLAVALNFVRMWQFVSSFSGRAKASRIADMDAHLSFEERIAERLRELEKVQGTGPVAPGAGLASPTSPSSPPASNPGFGRKA